MAVGKGWERDLQVLVTWVTHATLSDPCAPLQVGVRVRERLPDFEQPHQQRVSEAQGSGYHTAPGPGPPGVGCGRLCLSRSGELTWVHFQP